MLPPGPGVRRRSAPRPGPRSTPSTSHSFYFNLKAARKKVKEFDTPYTPAHTLILALRAALRRIKDEGIENVWQRHRRMSEACQAGVQALGLELFSARPAEGLTAFRVPEGLKDSDIRNKLTERFGITTVGGQDKLKGKIIRIGHMGYTDELDVVARPGGAGDGPGRAGPRRRARLRRDRRPAGLDGPADRGSGGSGQDHAGYRWRNSGMRASWRVRDVKARRRLLPPGFSILASSCKGDL